MERSLLFLLFCFTILACNNSAHQNQKQKLEANDTSLSSSGYEDKSDSGEFIPSVISAQYLKTRPLLLSDPINQDSALRALIPGRYYYSTKEDTVRLVAWKLLGNSKSAGDWDGSQADSFPFPDPEFNQTRIKDVLYYKNDKGQDYSLLVLSTSNERFAMLVGRFERAFLGIAIFKKSNSKWELQFFDPKTICTGELAETPHLKILKIGKNNFAAYFTHTSGSAGENIGDLYLMGFMNQNWTLLMNHSLSEYSNFIDSSFQWVSNISTQKNSSNTYYFDICVLTEGKILSPKKIDSNNFFLESLPADLVKIILRSKKDSLHFKFSTLYHFQNNKYKLVKQEVLEVK